MSENSQTQLQLYAKQILNDYDTKTPSILSKNNINISIVDAYKIQSIVKTHLLQTLIIHI